MRRGHPVFAYGGAISLFLPEEAGASVSTTDPAAPGGQLLPITEVEHLTGIRQATLRVWERRYGFPQPLRNRHGERVYPPDQVARLQEAQRLIQAGARPGRIFAGAAGQPALSLQAPAQASAEQQALTGMLRDYRLADLHLTCQLRLMDLGLRRFVTDWLAPLSAAVWEAWRAGELPVRCVHLFVQLAASVLQARLSTVRSTRHDRPKAVLATLAGDRQPLGILMAEAVLTTLDVECIQLGADVPAQEVAAAALESGAALVALSFGAAFPRRGLARAVAQLRGALPPRVALWIGGAGTLHAGELPAGVQVIASLGGIAAARAAWRPGEAA